MSGLSDTTKQAINETAGFAAGIVGITGTVVQTMTSMMTAQTAETIASGNAAVGDNMEASASTRAAAAINGMMIGVTLVIVALKYFSAKQKAIADEAKKKWTSALDSIVADGGGNADAIQASMRTEMEARSKSAALFSSESLAVAGGMAVVGAAWGSSLGPLGGLIGGVAGGLIGLFTVTQFAEGVVNAETAAREAEVTAIRSTIDHLIEMNNAQKTLKDTLADIGSSGLSEERQVELRLEATQTSLGVDTSGNSQEAEKQIAKIAEKLGASVADVKATGGDADKLAKLGDKTGGFLGFGNESKQIAAKSASALTVALMEQKAAVDLATIRTKEAGETYTKAAAGLRGAANFTEMKKALPAFVASIKQRDLAISKSAELEIQAAEAKLTTAKKGGEDTEINVAKANLKALRKSHATTTRINAEGDRKTREAVGKRIKADMLAAAATEAFRKEMVKTNQFMAALGGIDDAQRKEAKKIKNQRATDVGGDLDFSVERTTGLGDLTMVRDVKKFEKELRHTVSAFAPAMRTQANKLVDGVAATVTLMTKGKERLVGKRIGPRDKAPSARAILKSMGIDPDQVDTKVMGQVSKDVADAFKDKVMDAGEFDKIFGPFIKIGQDKAKALGQMQDQWNGAITNHVQQLKRQEDTLNRRIAAEERMVGIQNKNEVMLAKARGADDTDIGKIMDRQEKKTAQRGLRGTGVMAGDIGGAAKARDAAKLRMRQIDKELRSNNLSLTARKKLATEHVKMKIILQKTTGEIQRLGDQSEKAGRLMEKIDAEKAKRETMKGLVTDFVVGGQEERQGMQKSMRGIQFAMATGTLQNQSSEQRQATVGMLDRLGDIEIPGSGGLKGAEVKDRLIREDARRMGLDPKVLKAIFEKTSKEEKLIDALGALTKVMEAANKAEAEGIAAGGLVHMAGGGTIFKPRGTDTVPAMLTPGEFVIKKSSVDKIGAGNLAALNNGGGAVYAKEGGGWMDWAYRILSGQPSSSSTKGKTAKRRAEIAELMKGTDAEKLKTGYSDEHSLALQSIKEKGGHSGAIRAGQDDVMENLAKKLTKQKAASEKAAAAKKAAVEEARQKRLDKLEEMTKNKPKPSGIPKQKSYLAGSGVATADRWGPWDDDLTNRRGYSGPVVRGNSLRPKKPKIDLGLAGDRLYVGSAGHSQRIGNVVGRGSNVVGGAIAGVGSFIKRGIRDRKDTQFREKFIGGGKPTPSKPGKFEAAWQNRFGEEGRAAHQAAIDESVDSGGRGHVTAASPVNVAAQTAMDRAEREMALFKAQQARQAQPAQTRGGRFKSAAELQKEKPGRSERTSFDSSQLIGENKRKFEEAQADRATIKRERMEAFRQKRAAGGKRKYDEYAVEGSTWEREEASRLNRQARAVDRAQQRRQILGKPANPQKWNSRQEKVQARKRMLAARNMASGGQVDSIPAMLTPGEFVMNRGAVQRHGVGYMRSLNRGNVPGFNSGGIVGTKYLQNGSRDKVGGGGLASALDKMSTDFTALNGVLTKLHGVFSNLEMTHNFKGDMSLAFAITNIDAVTKAVGDAITPHITDMIVANMNSRLGGFDATGSTGTV